MIGGVDFSEIEASMVRPNVLFLAHRVPYPPDKGDQFARSGICAWLSQRAAVHLACLADEPVARADYEVLCETVERVSIVPLGRWSRGSRIFGSLACGGTATGAFASARSACLEWVLGP